MSQDNAGMVKLDQERLRTAAGELAKMDAGLAGILNRWGCPPLWDRPAGFPTLLHIILEQQVSLASARAAFERLKLAAKPLTPERFLQFSDEELKVIGFSRQKAGYGRGLARMILEGQLDLEALETMSDDEVRLALLAVKGVGAWTVDIYLLMVLLRPDVWPHGDRALAVSVQKVLRLPACPSYDELREMSAAWRPWRAAAARLFWHDYLSEAALRREAKSRLPAQPDIEEN